MQSRYRRFPDVLAYLFSFLGGVAVGVAATLLLKKKTPGDTPSPEVIKIIIERIRKMDAQHKKTEEIVAVIDALLKK